MERLGRHRDEGDRDRQRDHGVAEGETRATDAVLLELAAHGRLPAHEGEHRVLLGAAGVRRGHGGAERQALAAGQPARRAVLRDSQPVAAARRHQAVADGHGPDAADRHLAHERHESALGGAGVRHARGDGRRGRYDHAGPGAARVQRQPRVVLEPRHGARRRGPLALGPGEPLGVVRGALGRHDAALDAAVDDEVALDAQVARDVVFGRRPGALLARRRRVAGSRGAAALVRDAPHPHQAEGVVDHANGPRVVRPRALDERVKLAAVAVRHRGAPALRAAAHRPRGHTDVALEPDLRVVHRLEGDREGVGRRRAPPFFLEAAVHDINLEARVLDGRGRRLGRQDRERAAVAVDRLEHLAHVLQGRLAAVREVSHHHDGGCEGRGQFSEVAHVPEVLGRGPGGGVDRRVRRVLGDGPAARVAVNARVVQGEGRAAVVEGVQARVRGLGHQSVVEHTRSSLNKGTAALAEDEGVQIDRRRHGS
mmetsp:Transcript_2840/g.8280  ORF Transcript_2840/g.8280 Transcript_2840/m.8280 type:complete len:482 (-) Transcript_2840:319-1764(-)